MPVSSGCNKTMLAWLSTNMHRIILQGLTAFCAAAVEAIRLELVVYSVVLSNLANATKEQRLAFQRVAIFLQEYIEQHRLDAHDTNNAPPEGKLPPVVLKVLDTYLCRCNACDPAFSDVLL